MAWEYQRALRDLSVCVCVSVWRRALAKWLKYKGKNVCVCVFSAKEWKQVQLSMREEKSRVHACFVNMKEMNTVYEENHSWVYGDQVHNVPFLSISSPSSPSSCLECCLRLLSVVVMMTSYHCRWRALDSQDLDRERFESQSPCLASTIKY